VAQNIVAVITGDINGSSRLSASQAKQLEGLLQECFDLASTTFSAAGLTGFTCFRGDAYQFVVRSLEMTPRINLFFRALLLDLGSTRLGKKLHSSGAIGFGPIEFLPDSNSSAGGGLAYELSGKRLDKLRRRLPGVGVAGLGELDSCLDSILGLIDALTRQWTPLQAKAVVFALQGITQQEIAERWTPPISQQAVNKHLLSAGWPAIEPSLLWLETTLQACKLQNNLPS